MPEGHTIHRLACDQQRDFAGQPLRVTSPQGRFRSGAARLNGRMLESIDAYGKHLFYRWDGGRILHVHLGLYGRYRYHPVPPPPPRGQVRVRAIAAEMAWDLNGPNCCEILNTAGKEQILNRLGPDPLRRDADPERVWRRITRSRTAIGKLLLDQSVIAGTGNIYRADALFAIGVHPERAGRSVSREEFDDLWSTLTRMMRTGLRYNRIINVDPKRFGKPPSRLSRDERLLVYKRDYCLDCHGEIESWDCGARRIFACPQCQL
jgi:endonuclease-8